MKILHYSLGLPPYRSGGLTRYSIDLMKTQKEQGDDVCLLFPGHYSLITSRTRIKWHKNYYGINVYEIINPLPVPLLGGVGLPELFERKSDKRIYSKYLVHISPDVIHVHTLMGLHKEFLESARDLNIKIIFTTHDYYGICPRVNLLRRNGQICDDYDCGKECVRCNEDSYSISMIRLMQARIYRHIKEKNIIKKIRTMKKSSYEIKDEFIVNKRDEKDCSASYVGLRDFYFSMFSLFDKVHFNSTLTENIYRGYFPNIKGDVISISHGEVKDKRHKKEYNMDDNLKITYLGPIAEYKGIFLLINSLLDIEKCGINEWQLDIYGDNRDLPQNLKNEKIKVHGKYNINDLERIFDNSDIVVVPSIWYETFGFTVLEAISYGVPVMVSKNVGAKDLISNKNGFLVDTTIDSLGNSIKNIILNRNLLKRANENICSDEFKYDMSEHSMKIKKFYSE